jgi:hypothetical protein
MSRTTPAQKLSLALRLLIGMKHSAVREALRPHGFQQETLDDGWRLLVAAGRDDPSAPTPSDRDGGVDEAGPAVDPKLVAFQERWFPVARIVLRVHLRETPKHLSVPLRVNEGLASALSVSWFLRRLRALAESADPNDRNAREVLRARGLTDEVESEGRELVAQSAHKVAAPASRGYAFNETALAALWTWYLEWQGLARTVISNKNLLRALGLASTSGRPTGIQQAKNQLRVRHMSTSAPENSAVSGHPPRQLGGTVAEIGSDSLREK